MTKWKTALKDTFEISAQTLQDTQVPCSKGSGPPAPLLPTRHKHGSDYLFTGCSYGNHWPCRCRLQGCFILMHSRMIHCDVGAAANIASKLFAYFGNYQSKLRIIADYTKNKKLQLTTKQQLLLFLSQAAHKNRFVGNNSFKPEMLSIIEFALKFALKFKLWVSISFKNNYKIPYPRPGPG